MTESTEIRWVKRAEAARLMGVTERTIHRWMASGKMKYRRDRATGRVAVAVQVPAAEKESPQG